jgi:hypothetical protein
MAWVALVSCCQREAEISSRLPEELINDEIFRMIVQQRGL